MEGTSFAPEIQEQRGQPDRIKEYIDRISVSFRMVPDQLPFVLAVAVTVVMIVRLAPPD